MLRRLVVVVLLLLVAIVVAADRVGAHVASNVLADKLQTDEHFPSRPATSIGGVPFLTQAFNGVYSDVDVTGHGFVTSDGVRISTLSAHLHGVHIPLGKVVHGTVSQVPVDRVDGTAFVGFPDINRYFTSNVTPLTVRPASDGSLRVLRRVAIGKQTVTLRGSARVGLATGNIVTITVSGIRALHLNGQLPAASRLLQSYTLSLPLRALPFRIELKSVHVGAGGISGTGTATDVVLGS